jgi:hypothetical protein
MTKKQEETQNLLGLVAQAHPSNASLVRYSSAGHTSTAITKTEERIEREAHKQLLVEELQGLKTRRGQREIRMMHDTAADEYHGLIEHQKAIKQTFTGDEYDVYTDKFNHVNAQMAARHLSEAVEVGAGRVIDEIGRSLYLKEEERRGLFGR